MLMIYEHITCQTSHQMKLLQVRILCKRTHLNFLEFLLLSDNLIKKKQVGKTVQSCVFILKYLKSKLSHSLRQNSSVGFVPTALYQKVKITLDTCLNSVIRHFFFKNDHYFLHCFKSQNILQQQFFMDFFLCHSVIKLWGESFQNCFKEFFLSINFSLFSLLSHFRSLYLSFLLLTCLVFLPTFFFLFFCSTFCLYSLLLFILF